jgi:uncharacterized protein YndB with AHSA1/START domain
MATVKNSIIINAPVEKVFEYLTPENLPEIWPSLVEVSNVEELPNGGYSWDFVYKMAGMRLAGQSTHIEFVPNERTVSQTTGGIESMITWEYQTVDDGTKVTSTVEYKVPIPVLGKLAESAILKMNENEGKVIFENVKARLEA